MEKAIENWILGCIKRVCPNRTKEVLAGPGFSDVDVSDEALKLAGIDHTNCDVRCYAGNGLVIIVIQKHPEDSKK